MISGEQDKPGMAERNWEGAGAGGGVGGLNESGDIYKIIILCSFCLKLGA